MSKRSRSFSAADAAKWISPPNTHDDKYTRGVLGVRTGSAQYPGAAALGVEAAWRTGIGMVRYVAPSTPADPQLGATPAQAVLARRPETVFGDGRADAWLSGSGVDHASQPQQDQAALTKLFEGVCPLVLDAGALPALAAHGTPNAPIIITPHRGEFAQLWVASGCTEPAWLRDRNSRPSLEELTEATVTLASKLQVTVLLKGSITTIASPSAEAVHTGPATPWLATAGTGDVLGGVLGALVAAHSAQIRHAPNSTLVRLGATAALIHDCAARLASGDAHSRTTAHHSEVLGRPITALDVADSLPQAFCELRSGHASGSPQN